VPRRFSFPLLALVGVLILPVLVAPTAVAEKSRAPGHPVVRTPDGLVRGVRAEGVENFLGIRFAEPPTGDLRWEPPKPARPWRGVASAERWGNRCAALADTNGPEVRTEDCLFINVQRPAGVRAGADRPVFVWIHGGGLRNGGADQHDGTFIINRTGALVVTFHYRLGVLGFLGHPALTTAQGESGNYGFQDQQAALRWVRTHIASFGGDPDRVTIGGQSAGGSAVCAHLASPGSKGLFQAAVIQSANCEGRTQALADLVGTQVAAKAGCPDPATAVACLRRTPVKTLLDAEPENAMNFVHGTPTLPVEMRSAVATGRFNRVRTLVGGTRDEGRTFTTEMVGWTRGQYEYTVRLMFGADADAVLSRYPWPAESDRFTAAYLLAAVFGDSGRPYDMGGCATRRLVDDFARHVPTYAYEFDHRTGPGLRPQPEGFVWGAAHAAELPYMWPSFDNGTPIAATFTREERRLARDMTRYWGGFLWSGRPWSLTLPWWPRYVLALDGAERQRMQLRPGGESRRISDATFVAEHQCDFWNSL
jgi:carboxylesterase type B